MNQLSEKTRSAKKANLSGFVWVLLLNIQTLIGMAHEEMPKQFEETIFSILCSTHMPIPLWSGKIHFHFLKILSSFLFCFFIFFLFFLQFSGIFCLPFGHFFLFSMITFNIFSSFSFHHFLLCFFFLSTFIYVNSISLFSLFHFFSFPLYFYLWFFVFFHHFILSIFFWLLSFYIFVLSSFSPYHIFSPRSLFLSPPIFSALFPPFYLAYIFLLISIAFFFTSVLLYLDSTSVFFLITIFFSFLSPFAFLEDLSLPTLHEDFSYREMKKNMMFVNFNSDFNVRLFCL